MENIVKGIHRDVGNDSKHYWYCSDNRQYYCHVAQYQEKLKETKERQKATAPTKVMM